MLFQPALDDLLIRIELALSPGVQTRGVGLAARPLCDRFFIDVQFTADLCKAQTTLFVIELDLTIKLIGDHGCCCCPPASKI
jgi:hypothetical protein